MLVFEIIERAQTQAEEVYDTATWIQFINEALDDLTPVAKMLTTKDGIAVSLTGGNGAITIASDPNLVKAHEFINVYFTPAGGNLEQLKGPLPISNTYTKGWKQTATQILLQNCGSVNGTAKVDYYKKLDHVSSVNDIPELPEQYHNLLILYACAKSQQKEEELNDKNDFYNEYLRGKNNMAIDRIWMMEPQNRKFICKARIAALIGAQV